MYHMYIEIYMYVYVCVVSQLIIWSKVGRENIKTSYRISKRHPKIFENIKTPCKIVKKRTL